ncbi:MAG: TetR/AcrR family transcriptional regulator [Pseudomonadota bacterium]
MTEQAESAKARRKPRRRKDARPAEILAAGMTEFQEYGFHGANLSRIAQRAGIAKGTIYLYYDSKEALFLAAVGKHVVSIMGESEAQVDVPGGTTKELLIHFLRGMYNRFVDSEAQAVFRILIAEGDRMPEVMRDYHAMTVQRGTTLLSKILERGVARGEVRPGSVVRMPHVLMAPTVFFAVHDMMFKNVKPVDFDSFFEAHIDMLMNGCLID